MLCSVIFLIAPLVRGGTAGLVARPGLGQMVILTELARRLRQRSFATVLWLPEREADFAGVLPEVDGDRAAARLGSEEGHPRLGMALHVRYAWVRVRARSAGASRVPSRKAPNSAYLAETSSKRIS
ncbi:MAG: hypothetical protein ACOY94_11495 [Bacillota bacterium]